MLSLLRSSKFFLDLEFEFVSRVQSPSSDSDTTILWAIVGSVVCWNTLKIDGCGETIQMDDLNRKANPNPRAETFEFGSSSTTSIPNPFASPPKTLPESS